MTKRRGRFTNGHNLLPPRIDDDLLRELWASDRSTLDICHEVGGFHREVLDRARELGLPPRPRICKPDPIPTPDEILERAARLRRERWSEEEHRIRDVSRQASWEAPVVRVMG